MRSSALLALVLCGALACEGDQGPMGPEGPEGPPGNANVVAGNFTVAPNDWINDFWYFTVSGGTQGNQAKVVTVNVPQITADIINSGAVLLYLRVPATHGAATHWAQLPFMIGGFGGGYLVSIHSAVREGQIRLAYLHTHSDAANIPPSVYDATLPSYEFRYVAIAGAPAAAVAKYSALGDPDLVLAALRRDAM